MRKLADTPISLRLTGAIWLMLLFAWGGMIVWETRVNRETAIGQALHLVLTGRAVDDKGIPVRTAIAYQPGGHAARAVAALPGQAAIGVPDPVGGHCAW